MAREVYERSPTRLFSRTLREVEAAGSLGVVISEAGVGKSALLVHIALDALLRDQQVLHVSLRDSVEHVRAYYDEIFAALARVSQLRDKTAAMMSAERHRMIHCYLDRTFSVEHLATNLRMLGDVAQFHPRLMVVDGLSLAEVEAGREALTALAQELGCRIWLSVTASNDERPALLDQVTMSVKLAAAGRSVQLELLPPSGPAESLPFRLDPVSMLVEGSDDWDPSAAPNSPDPADATLYSGGANGAESAFGEAAEAWGVAEVNFTFDGHRQVRARGRYELSPRELAAGDVSLVYVSRRLNRTYSEGTLIRKVLQSLWHMVSRSQQIFVIGSIQEDGTVVGGTGWSVELARMWNKSLWVFDQDKDGWYRWDGAEWVQGTPVIEAFHFTGTGTRYLEDNAKQAVRELFERSFARREA